MDVYLVRHTKPALPKGICYGQSDIDLEANFMEDIETVRSQIPNYTSCKVYTSPLKRCAILAKACNAAITVDPRLMELDFGDWELLPWDAISQDAMAPWMTDFVNVATPNGESYTALSTRVWQCISELTASASKQPLIIVTHAGPIRAVLSQLLNMSLKDSFAIPVHYGDVFSLKLTKGTLELISNIKF